MADESRTADQLGPPEPGSPDWAVLEVERLIKQLDDHGWSIWGWDDGSLILWHRIRRIETSVQGNVQFR